MMCKPNQHRLFFCFSLPSANHLYNILTLPVSKPILFRESGFSALTLKLAHKIPGILKRAVSGRWVMLHQPHIIVPKDVFMYGRIRLWQFRIAFVFLYSLTVRRNRLFETPNHLVS